MKTVIMWMFFILTILPFSSVVNAGNDSAPEIENERIIFRDGKLAGNTSKLTAVTFEEKPALKINFQSWGNSINLKEQDWSCFEAIKLEIYSARSGKEKMIIALDSEPGEKATGNYYSTPFPITWTGWRTVVLPLKQFSKSRNPVGWNQINQITFHTQGYGLKPESDANVVIRDISLLPGQPEDPNAGLRPGLYPINTAEWILSVFWDRGLSDYRDWKTEQGSASQTGWDLSLSWTDTLRITRSLDLDCTKFDTIIPAIGLLPGVLVKVEAETDQGILQTEYTVPNDNGKTSEFPLSIKGSKVLKRITVTLKNANGDPGTGMFKYVLLADSVGVKNVERMYADIAKIDFDKYIVSDRYFYPTFLPGLNLYCDADKLCSLRDRILADPELKKRLNDISANLNKAGAPEKNIRAYSTRDRRFGRDRDIIAADLYNQTEPAWCGMLLCDADLLRLAARRAIALVLTPHWGAGMMASLPGTTFEHRCFDESLIMERLAFTLDFCYEFFTPYGRELILRTLAERGAGTANFNAWRYEYIYRCNQLSAFSAGRIATYLAMEKSNWERVKPYTDLAIAELNDSMKFILEPDGGYLEGASYYQYTLSGAFSAYYLYARARGKEFTAILPPQLQGAPDYIELMLSTDDRQGFLPLCDGGSYITPQVVQILAEIFPESQFGRLCNKYRKLSGMISPSERWSYLAGNPLTEKKEVPLRPFVKIDSLSSAASVRTLAGNIQKIFVTGDARNGGHKHNDAGSFMIEYAGETYAMDSGICSYASPFSHELKKEERHNVMVPLLKKGGYAHQKLVPEPLKVSATGDGNRFEFSVDLAPCWNGMFKKRTRQIVSESPDNIVLTDTFEVANECNGVRFFYLSPFPIELKDRLVSIHGTKAELTFAIPDGWEIQTERLTRVSAPDQYRLSLTNNTQQGELRLEIKTVPVTVPSP